MARRKIVASPVSVPNPSVDQLNGVLIEAMEIDDETGIIYVGGIALTGGGSGAPSAEVALTPSDPGDFTVAHGLASTPSAVLIQMTSGGLIWFQTPLRYDDTNLYLVASDADITGNAEIWS